VTYERLFSSGKIGRLEVPNRIVMLAMGTVLADSSGEVTEHEIKYFEERARGGTGLIITEVTVVDNELGKTGTVNPRADDNRFIPSLARLAEAVHKYDTRIFVQLAHAGRQGRTALTEGRQLVAPSAIMCRATGEEPRALSAREIRNLVVRFGEAALRCQLAGMDGVELHAAHGYLLNQFISPHTNRRTDEYGGTFEKRLRIMEEIVAAIRDRCGADLAICARISVDEFVEGGITLEMGKEIVAGLEQFGVDAINVSCGIYESIPNIIEPIYYRQGWRVPLAEAVKQVTSLPVITAGVIREPDFAEQVLANGQADFVGLGRGLLADPFWARKAREGRADSIRKCISCNFCLREETFARHISCAVNARAGRELELAGGPEPCDLPRKVVVAGGGPGGMEAARVLAERGCEVVLMEKSGALGGRLEVASAGEGKDKNSWVRDYLAHELERPAVSVLLNTECSLERLKQENPDAVVVAVGGHPTIPEIAGLKDRAFFLAEDVILGSVHIRNARILVLGGGFTGCEAAETLADEGNMVTIAEQLPAVATEIEGITRAVLLGRLEERKVEILLSHRAVLFDGDRVVFEVVDGESRAERQFDHVVIAVGMRAETGLADQVLREFRKAKVVGDAKKPGMIAGAIRDGFAAGYTI